MVPRAAWTARESSGFSWRRCIRLVTGGCDIARRSLASPRAGSASCRYSNILSNLAEDLIAVRRCEQVAGRSIEVTCAGQRPMSAGRGRCWPMGVLPCCTARPRTVPDAGELQLGFHPLVKRTGWRLAASLAISPDSRACRYGPRQSCRRWRPAHGERVGSSQVQCLLFESDMPPLRLRGRVL